MTTEKQNELNENQPITANTTPSTPTPPTQQKKVAKKASPIAITIASMLGALILIGGGLLVGMVRDNQFSPTAIPALSSGEDGNKTVTNEESSIASVAEKVGPSVVSIVAQTQARSFYGPLSSQAAGTGIIVSKNGYIMTNNHVIENTTSISVIDSDGELYDDVTVIGRDPLNDIAFLKISSKTEFTPASLGNSATLRTGQQVVAIGNALGQYSHTVTSGIVSGTGRPVTASSGRGTNTESLTDLIQTDASINHGNSGGPLVNMAGQVIGVNTAIAEDANGIGFAIPINSTKGILAGVLETGKISRAFLGVSYLTVTPDVAREYSLPVKAGAYLHSGTSASAIAANGPAQKAGLKDGDIITKINDQVIGKQGNLSSILGEYKPGDKLTITYLRSSKQSTVTVQLEAYNQ